jgi:hypothetical protein
MPHTVYLRYESSNAGLLWRKLLPDLEDDLRLSNEEIGKFKILDTVCAMRSSETVNEDNEECLRCDTCELGFQHLTDTTHRQCRHKTKGRRKGWGG